MVWKSLSEALEGALIDALNEGTEGQRREARLLPPAATTRMGMVVRSGGDEPGDGDSSPSPTRRVRPARSELGKTEQSAMVLTMARTRVPRGRAIRRPCSAMVITMSDWKRDHQPIPKRSAISSMR